MNAKHPIAMHVFVDQMRGPFAILGVCPPVESETKKREFGGAILIELCILHFPCIATYPTTLEITAANTLRIETLRSAERIHRVRWLMIGHEVSSQRTRIFCAACVAPIFRPNSIDFTALRSSEIPVRSSGRY